MQNKFFLNIKIKKDIFFSGASLQEIVNVALQLSLESQNTNKMGQNV